MPKEHLSHGEAVNRRRALAIARKTALLDLDARILEKQQARDRLKDIDWTLSPESLTFSEMTQPELDQTRASLEIERVWLQSKLGIITPVEKQRSIENVLKRIKSKPEVHRWLISENEHGVSMLQRIRDKVNPPVSISGYHTTRL
jgi:hypothetical protein